MPDPWTGESESPEEYDGCDGSHWGILSDTLHQLLQSVIYSKKCSTYWLYQWVTCFAGSIDKPVKYGVFSLEKRSNKDVQRCYKTLKHRIMSVLHSGQPVFAACIAFALCYLDIWMFFMINPSYVLHWTRPNLYSAGSTKSFYAFPVRGGCLKDWVFPC